MGLPLIYKTYSQDKRTLTGTAEVSWAAALQFGQSPDCLNINNQNDIMIRSIPASQQELHVNIYLTNDCIYAHE